MNNRSHNGLIAATALVVAGLCHHHASASVWDGSGDPDASGNWNVAANWEPDGVPSAVTAELNNVTSGTRTVTLTATPSAINQLQMTQTTAGAVNQLNLNTVDADLLFDGSMDPLSLIPTAGAGSVVLNLAGGDIDVATANGRTAALAGTVNLSNGSRFLLRNSGATASYTISGALNFDNTLGSTALRVDNGQGSYTVNATGSISVVGGTTNIGRLSSGSTNRGQTLLNRGTVDIANGSRLTVRAAQSFEIATYDNEGETNVGSAIDAGEAVLEAYTLGGGSGGNGRVLNRAGGVLNVYDRSYIDLGNRSDAGIHAELQNAAGGELNIYAAATGGGIRSTFSTNDQVTGRVLNQGVITVTRHATAARGLGLMTHSGRAARWTVTNGSSGELLVNDDADLEIATSNTGTGTKTLTVDNQEGGTIVLGRNAVDAATGSTLTVAAHGTSDTATAATISVTNGGLIRLLGTSHLRLADDSIMTSWSIANAATGEMELNYNSSIGSSSKALSLTNGGSLRKLADGTSQISSASGGSFSSTGLVEVAGGTLQVSTDVSFGTGGDLQIGIDGASSGLLQVAGLFSLAGDNVLSIDGLLTAPSYTVLTATAGISGVFSDVSDVTNQGYSVVYGDNSIALVVPEPAAAAMMTLAGGGLLLARRRT
jgi:hypothetical protein